MKDYLISHIKDIDGVTPVILMNLTNREFDYHLLDVYEVEEFMNEFLEQDLSIYEHIYITDLTVPESIYEKIEKHSHKDKFLIFDHHKTHAYAGNYSYVTLDLNECGTTLFYNYLKTIYNIETPALNTYIKSVKNLDLWLFEQAEDKIAPILDSLFGLYGETRYIDEMTKKFQSVKEEFILTPFEIELLKVEEESKKRYIDKHELRMIKGRLKDISVGIVFAEKYRSELGHELLNRHPEIDVAIVINMNGGISLRSREVDVSELAKEFGGGGHKLASGMSVLEDSIYDFLEHQFKGCVTFENK